jgi:hypothetical protein
MQIDSIAAQPNASVPRQFMLDVFRMLENAAKFSLAVNKRLFDDSEFIGNLSSYLPRASKEEEGRSHSAQYSSEQYPFVGDVIGIFSALLADKPEEDADALKDDSSHAKSLRIERAFEA